MKYLSIDLSTLRSPEYIGSAPIERGTWLSVLGYCADQENGGRIVGAMTWKDRQWQQVCGVTLREVRATTRLLLVEGDDVIVFDYPLYLEEEIRNRRASGRAGGQARAQAKAQAARENGAQHTQAQPKECLKHNPSGTQGVLEANTQAQPKECFNVREGKVREGKVSNTEIQAPPTGDAGVSLDELNRNLAVSPPRMALPTEPVPENPSAAKETAKDAKPAAGPAGDLFARSEAELPASLETEQFRAAWRDWLAYRSECKIPKYKPRAMAAQLAMLAEWGPDVAICAIRQSIRQQWRGLFEPKGQSSGTLSTDAQNRSDEIAKKNRYEY